MRLSTVAIVAVWLMFIGTSVNSHKFSLHALHQLSKKHLKTLQKMSIFSTFRLQPHILVVPHRTPQLRKVIVIPEPEISYHEPVFRDTPKIMEGIDPIRLAMDWPNSVTPGGPGPEWW